MGIPRKFTRFLWTLCTPNRHPVAKTEWIPWRGFGWGTKGGKRVMFAVKDSTMEQCFWTVSAEPGIWQFKCYDPPTFGRIGPEGVGSESLIPVLLIKNASKSSCEPEKHCHGTSALCGHIHVQYAREEMGSHFRFSVKDFWPRFPFVRIPICSRKPCNILLILIFRKLVFWS